MNKRISVDRTEFVATVNLNRENKRNAVDSRMFEALGETAETLASDRSLRAVILSGRGDHFCAGIDLGSFAGPGMSAFDEGKMRPRDPSPANFFQSAAYAWRTLPVPVIAALRGVAFGAGFQIAMGADIRYAAPDLQMSIMEIKWGIIPDMGISATLRHVAAADKVRELAFTGRIIDATEAEALGLVTAIRKDPMAAAQQTAATIAGRSPDAIRAIKTLINEAWEQRPDSALRTEAALQVRLLASANHKEAVLANMEDRAPRFSAPELD